MARSTVNNSLNALDVGLPGSVGTSVGVGDLNTEGNALATIITLSHSLHLLTVINHGNHALNRRLNIIADSSEKSKSFFQNFYIIFKIKLIFSGLAVIIDSRMNLRT